MVYYDFDVLNLVIKAFWLLVEWKFFIMVSHCTFQMIFLLLESYLESIFLYVGVYEILKQNGLLQF